MPLLYSVSPVDLDYDPIDLDEIAFAVERMKTLVGYWAIVLAAMVFGSYWLDALLHRPFGWSDVVFWGAVIFWDVVFSLFFNKKGWINDFRRMGGHRLINKDQFDNFVALVAADAFDDKAFEFIGRMQEMKRATPTRNEMIELLKHVRSVANDSPEDAKHAPAV